MISTRAYSRKQEAQTAWVDLLLTGPGRMIGMGDCTPGYYNNEGGKVIRSHLGEMYGPGFYAFDDLIKAWRESGKMEGLVLGE